jgi:hypothetical protein
VADFEIKGLDPVLAKLKALADPKLQTKAVRSAGTKAMRIVRDAARAKLKPSTIRRRRRISRRTSSRAMTPGAENASAA